LDPRELTGYLQDVLGQRLVAHIAGVDVKRVAAWAKGDSNPRPEAEERLRMAYRVFHLIQENESPHTVRAWFIGVNPQLNDESPAAAIRDGRFKEVLVAARAFISGG
jgi:hypothetical protein